MGDRFTDKVTNEQVVVAIMANSVVYQTQVEVLKEGGWSQCDGPEDLRGLTHYYLITKEALEWMCNHFEL